MLTKLTRWPNPNVIAIVLISKLLVLVFAAQIFQVVSERPLAGGESFLGIWNRWDASLYLKIAQNGYASAGDDRFLIVFFPLYPLLVSFGEIFVRDYLVSAFLVTAFASIAAGLVLRELGRLDYSEKVAQLSVVFLFIFPTSYFLHIPYTESLFLALVMGSFLAARKRLWIVAGILGALACLTRVNGLVLLPALVFEVWEEYRETKQFNRRWLFLILIALGFLGYLLLNYVIAGDPLRFMLYQREHWYRYFRWPWEGIWETVNRVSSPKVVDAQMTGVFELLFVVIGAIAIVFGWKYLRNSYRIWMIANWLLFVSTSFVLSVPRYTLTLFPMFILMGIAAKAYRFVNFGFTVWSLLYLGLFITQFTRGMWAF